LDGSDWRELKTMTREAPDLSRLREKWELNRFEKQREQARKEIKDRSDAIFYLDSLVEDNPSIWAKMERVIEILDKPAPLPRLNPGDKIERDGWYLMAYHLDESPHLIYAGPGVGLEFVGTVEIFWGPIEREGVEGDG
jgi:hypothetical protein